MSKFIDAEKLKAEMERRINLISHGDAHPEVIKRAEGVLKGYNSILDFIDSLQQDQPVTATGQVFTKQAPKNIIVENDQWDALLGQFDNGQRVRIILVKEDAE